MKFATQTEISKENPEYKAPRLSLPLQSPRKLLAQDTKENLLGLKHSPKPFCLESEESRDSAESSEPLAKSIDARIDECGDTKLHIAARKNDLTKAKELLAAGAKVNARNDGGMTPMHYASDLKSDSMLQLLIANNARVNANSDKGRSPLHSAARLGRTSNIKLLLRSGAKINAGDDNGITPLHMAAYFGHKKALKELLKKEADVNALDIKGNTPLYYIVNNIDLAYALLEKGANPNIENKVGESPLHKAVKAGLLDNARMLIEAGSQFKCNMFEDGKTSPMHIAAELEDPSMLQLLIECRATTDSTDEDGETPLHIAVENGNAQHVFNLANALDANIDAQDPYGETALHKAVDLGNLDMITILINAGADWNIEDAYGFTPMEDAEDNDALLACMKSAISAKYGKEKEEYTAEISVPKRQAEENVESDPKKSRNDSAYETASSPDVSDDEVEIPVANATDAATPATSPAKTLILFESPVRSIDRSPLTDIGNLKDLEALEAPKTPTTSFPTEPAPAPASPEDGFRLSEIEQSLIGEV